MDAAKRMEEIQQKILEMTQSGNIDPNEYMQLAEELQELALLVQQQQMENLAASQQEQHQGMMREMGWQVDAEDEAEFQDMLAQQYAQFMDNPVQMGLMEEAFQSAANAALDLFNDDEDELSEEELAQFLQQNAPPAEYDKYIPIGAVLIGTHGEPYQTLALLQDSEYTRSVLEGGWGIEDREGALEMLESLLGGRHANRFAEIHQALKAGRTAGLDEDDVEDYQMAVAALVEGMELPGELVSGCETLLAWDLERVGYLARLFVNIGYITEQEAWAWMARAGAIVKERFESWEEYLVSLLIGRSVCYAVHQEPFAVALDLLTGSRSFLDQHPIADLG